MLHLLLSVMGAFAQFKRDLMREWQREGIAPAKLRGRLHRPQVSPLLRVEAEAPPPP